MECKRWTEIIKKIKPLDPEQKPRIYQLTPNPNGFEDDEVEDIRICEYGSLISSHLDHKTVLLLGERSSGKSSLINAMINFLAGVDFEDEIRLELVSIDKRLSNEKEWISIYIIHSDYSHLNYTIKIVDVPGISENKNSKRDKQILSRVEDLIEKKLDRIDSICLVINSTLVRLSDDQRYVLETLRPLLSKVSWEKRFVLATRSLSDECVVEAALKEVNLEYGEIFQFENGSIFVVESSQNRKREKQKEYFEEGQENFQGFFNAMNDENKRRKIEALKKEEKMSDENANVHEPQINKPNQTIEVTRVERENILKSQPENVLDIGNVGEYIVSNFNLQRANKVGIWTIHDLPIVHATNNEDKHALSKKIEVLEIANPQITTILILGSSRDERNNLLEFFLNFSLGIRANERIWLQNSSNQKSNNSDSISVYKFQPLPNGRLRHVLNIVDIPNPMQRDENAIKELSGQMKSLFQEQHLPSIDIVCYVVNSLPDKPPLILSLLSKNLIENTIVFSQKYSVEQLKQSVSSFNNHKKIPSLKESTDEDEINIGLSIVKEVLQLSNCSFKIGTDKTKTIIELWSSLFKISDSILSLQKILDVKNRELLMLKREIDKPPKSERQTIVVNCVECLTTCCNSDHHETGFTDRFGWSWKKPPLCSTLFEKSTQCTKCHHSEKDHEKSKNVKYSADPTSSNTQLSDKLERANGDIRQCTKMLQEEKEKLNCSRRKIESEPTLENL